MSWIWTAIGAPDTSNDEYLHECKLVVSNIYVTHFLSSTDFHDVLADVLEWPTVRSYPFIYELLLTNTGQSR
jgi:hypothetical protein